MDIDNLCPCFVVDQLWESLLTKNRQFFIVLEEQRKDYENKIENLKQALAMQQVKRQVDDSKIDTIQIVKQIVRQIIDSKIDNRQ